MISTNPIYAGTFRILATVALTVIGFNAFAGEIKWTDWTSSSNTGGFTAIGTITTSTSTVNVTYNNPQGVSFFNDGVGSETDYWAQGISGSSGRNPARSPYTSTATNGVDNIPTGTDMIALRFAGTQTLSFSEAIANPVFSYISLNGNGYAFDQDFEILSFGAGPANDIGYWGPGTSIKTVVDVGGGVLEYRLLGTREPHGTLRFTGAFDMVSWRSLSNENWNGFTVGVQGTAVEILPCEVNPALPQCQSSSVPEPTTLLLLGLGLAGLGFTRKRLH